MKNKQKTNKSKKVPQEKNISQVETYFNAGNYRRVRQLLQNEGKKTKEEELIAEKVKIDHIVYLIIGVCLLAYTIVATLFLGGQ